MIGAFGHYDYDAFGNIRLENSFEGVENRYHTQYDYSPFGVLISESGDLAGDNPFRFSTKYTDGESGRISLDPYIGDD